MIQMQQAQQHTESKEYYLKSATINPENSEVLYYLALTELSDGEIALGINHMNYCSTILDGYGQMAVVFLDQMDQDLVAQMTGMLLE